MRKGVEKYSDKTHDVGPCDQVLSTLDLIETNGGSRID